MTAPGARRTFSYKGVQLVAHSNPALTGLQQLLKRTVDVTAASLGLLLFWPLLLGVALAIRIDSRGPFFFRQVRVGRGGRQFRVWKFRTMHDGTSDKLHRDYVSSLLNGNGRKRAHVATDGSEVFKLVADPRVTRVGRWLRHTSLDELPQLVNVLRGEMSLVGPRPPLPYEVEEYDHWQFERLDVLPGITGLWQVSGRNLLTYLEMCEIDIQYVRQWCVWLDMKILLKTIPVVLLNSGRAA
jgi:lipopolysaccharide/colanic/teichoic acid biosynthesis glycosyltransferase